MIERKQTNLQYKRYNANFQKAQSELTWDPCPQILKKSLSEFDPTSQWKLLNVNALLCTLILRLHTVVQDIFAQQVVFMSGRGMPLSLELANHILFSGHCFEWTGMDKVQNRI